MNPRPDHPAIPPPTPDHAQITAHHKNPQNHSSDKNPQSPPPTPDHAQITVHHKNPQNHSSDKKPAIPPPTPARANHSPSRKSPKSQFRQKARNPPTAPHTHAYHSPSQKSPKSQFRQKARNPHANPRHAQITVHHENPPNHSSDKTPKLPVFTPSGISGGMHITTIDKPVGHQDFTGRLRSAIAPVLPASTQCTMRKTQCARTGFKT